MDKIMIPLADGLEEIEAVTNIDVLRRAGIDVVTVALKNDLYVKGDHGIELKADELIKKIEVEELSGIVLPGGMPGSKNLKNNSKLLKMIEEVNQNQGLLAAICAAPMVLEEAGILEKRSATSYPGFDKKMPSCNYQKQKVVTDGNIITGRGPGVALDFAFEIVAYLIDGDTAADLKANMIAD